MDIPWRDVLYQSYNSNYKEESQVYISMSNTKRPGDTSMHCIPFRGFLKEDNRFLLFSLSIHVNLLMGDIKSDPYANLCWIMPKTHEYYDLKGRFYIASLPTQVTRFPPPK